MQARFLLGPAGSGKTFRCLAEIRAELLRDPAGPPLILLAPKQATFQIERQLLSDPKLAGYTRLQILSFDRLARFALGEFAAIEPRLLDAEGRVMILRALLTQYHARLKTFHATARLPGFAQQLSRLLREFQHHRYPARYLLSLADKFPDQPALAGKLHDLAHLFAEYQSWLNANQLSDAEGLPEYAADEIARVVGGSKSSLRVAGLWVDGFTGLTPQELELLAAFLPACERTTLTFCLPKSVSENESWLSPWATVAQNYARCREQLTRLPGVQVAVEFLPDQHPTRFSKNPGLANLERRWSEPDASASNSSPKTSDAIALYRCASPETEAILAAREILRHVHNGGRYRETAIIVRSLDTHSDALRRVFTRYGIPLHFDRRESIAHHPLAELTRSALRLVTYGWAHDDWFGVLKTGLVTDEEYAVDKLENAALAHGWQGETWFKPLVIPGDNTLEGDANRWLKKILPPFANWRATLTQLQRRPTGNQLAAALRELWRELNVEKTLDQWREAGSSLAINHANIHASVFEQLDKWLGNIEIAFSDTPLALADWLPIMESGLGALTVGVIPPALDQVLVGTADRSRHPEIKLALVLGLNEGIFPAPVQTTGLLTETERDALADQNLILGPDRFHLIGQERFYGYMALTRAHERLVLTRAVQDTAGKALNASPFYAHAQQLTGVEEQAFGGTTDWWLAEHTSELAVPLLRTQHATLNTKNFPTLLPLAEKHGTVQAALEQKQLASELAAKVFGTELHSSVSRLEAFAECPFKFFAASTLKLQERKEFEFDARDKGSFHHDVIEAFHKRVRGAGRQWRDLAPTEAAALIESIAGELLPRYKGGKFTANGAARFAGAVLTDRLKRLITVLVGWMPQYDFDPVATEIAFDDAGHLPPWRLDLGNGRTLVLRGRIDRVDVCRQKSGPNQEAALAVVMDYKSRPKKLDAVRLHNGLELQLLSYLGVLKHLPAPESSFGVRQLIPAGVFFIPLNGGAAKDSGGVDADGINPADYQHSGRFLADALAHFDNRGLGKGDQFRFSLKSGGELGARGNDALPQAAFDELQQKVTSHLTDYAKSIFAGELKVDPYRQGRKTACDYCDFRSVCRFDPWTQPYRPLKPVPKPPISDKPRRKSR